MGCAFPHYLDDFIRLYLLEGVGCHKTGRFVHRLKQGALVGATVGSFLINGFFSEIIRPYAFLALGMATSLKVIKNKAVRSQNP
jgi:hypothetical protein